MNKRFPALDHLMGAYFHQDWDLAYEDDVWLLLDDFLRGSGTLAARLPQEIDQLLRELDDAQLGAFLDTEGLNYTASDFPGGYREWLTETARRARLGPDDSLLPPPFTDWRTGRYSTRFRDEETGQRVTETVVRAHDSQIARWVESGGERLVIEGTFPRAVGVVGNYRLGMSDQHVVRVVLVRDGSERRGYRVLASFPEFPRRGRTDLPGLRHLCDAYFYDNWDAQATYPAVVAAFATDSGPHADDLLEEIELLRPLSEEELDQILNQFGLQFSLVRDETWHAWLDDLAARIHEARRS